MGVWVGCLGVFLGVWVGCLGGLLGVWVGYLGVLLGVWVGCLSALLAAWVGCLGGLLGIWVARLLALLDVELRCPSVWVGRRSIFMAEWAGRLSASLRGPVGRLGFWPAAGPCISELWRARGLTQTLRRAPESGACWLRGVSGLLVAMSPMGIMPLRVIARLAPSCALCGLLRRV